MVRRILVVLCFALAAPLCRAQPPRIDSMFVDETKGELIVFGDLGPMQGFVFVDSVSMPVILWTDSVCRATIPLNGKGSAGLVEIGARGYRSDGRILTSDAIATSSTDYQLQPYFPTQFVNESKTLYHFRISYETALAHQASLVVASICKDSWSMHYNQSTDASHQTTTKTDTTWSVSPSEVISSPLTHQLVIGSFFQSPDKWTLSATLLPQGGSSCPQCAHSHGTQYDWGPVEHYPLPRPEFLVLTYKPTLTPADTSYFDGDIITLSWSAPTTPVDFELQYGLDSAFTVTSDDTTLSTTTFTTDLLATGYWRVRVKDSVGHGPWSNVARVQYLGVNAVPSTQPAATAMLAPNPCSSIVTIHFPTVSSECVLFDLLGRTVARSDANGELVKPLDVRMLAEGLYFARVFDGKASSILQLVVRR